MPTGDAAAAAGMALVDGTTVDAQTIDTEINLTRDYIANGAGATSEATALKVVKRDASGRFRAATPSASTDVANKGYVDVTRTIAQGGTGATTASAARTALGLVKTTTSADAGGKIPEYNAAGQLATATPTSSGHAANKAYVDAQTPPAFNGGTVTGQILLPNSYAASSGYVVCYINGDGRIARGASSERFKKFIAQLDPAQLGDVFSGLYRFQMRSGDGAWHVGPIAERMHENPATRPFVVYETDATGKQLALDEHGAPVPLSVDFVAHLYAMTAQLHARTLELEAQVAELRAAQNAQAGTP